MLELCSLVLMISASWYGEYLFVGLTGLRYRRWRFVPWHFDHSFNVIVYYFSRGVIFVMCVKMCSPCCVINDFRGFVNRVCGVSIL